MPPEEEEVRDAERREEQYTTYSHLKSGDKTLVFDIAATDDALLGRYTEVTCEIVFKQGGQEIRQRSGKGTLRVDPALATAAAKD